MLEISRFFGVSICIYYLDHNPPHFHASYQEFEASYSMQGKKMKGRLPPKVEKLVQGWAKKNKDALLGNWERMKVGQPPRKIEGADV